MLLRSSALDRITRGEISVVYRRWRKPTVRTGGTLRTAVGILNMLDVRESERLDSARETEQSSGSRWNTRVQTRGSRSGSAISCRMPS